MTTELVGTLALAAVEPFDFRQSVGFLCGFPATSGEQRTTSEGMTKALRAAGRTVIAKITAAPGSGVKAELYADAPLAAGEAEAAADRISFFLSLQDDLGDFYATGRKDAAFAPILDRLNGYHQVKFPSPLENMVWAILAQRNPMPVAAKSKQAIVAAFPENTLSLDGEEFSAFPDLEQLLTLSRAELGALVRNERKSGYLHEAVRAWSETDESFLRSGPYDEVRDFLLSLPGIGAWSASFILIRGLGRMEHLAYEKVMMQTASRVYGRPVGSERELRELAEPYGDHQGYWGHYLRAAG